MNIILNKPLYVTKSQNLAVMSFPGIAPLLRQVVF